jgi:phospholipase/carboxylesterase
VVRYLDPAELPMLLAAVGEPEAPLKDAHEALAQTSPALASMRPLIEAACGHVVAAYEGLRAAAHSGDRGIDMGQVYRALRGLPRAQEALWPLAGVLDPVSRFFLDPAARDDAALLARLAEAPARDDVGLMQAGQPGERGGFSLYVPEYYSPDRDWPLVVALHGGAGNGTSFIWSWLRDARTHGAILLSPTAVGDTWALAGPDVDTPNLVRILEAVRGRWRIDAGRVLLTGMSDGGTFAYVSGLEPGSPFTHVAPISAAFHPMLAAMADRDRLQGLPMFLAHGALDWMFPVEMAREARDALVAAGAEVTYREIADLSHTYPREINGEILAWLNRTAPQAGS